jgi:thiosulfate reductase cytochrome b subunit
VSGVHIFLDFPELYWGKVGFQGHPAAFRLADWGISWEQAGEWGDRRWGRNHHFTFGWVFVINGLIYGGWSVSRRHFGAMLPRPAARAADGEPPARPYGRLQGTAYLLVLFGLTPLLFLTGLAQMPAFTAIAPWLIDLFGGRQTARTLHVIATVALVLFALGHVGNVIARGFLREMRAMITGRVPRTEQ